MNPAHKPRPRNRKRDPNRQRIINAARGHFFNHGFRSVTMDDLAEELGISKKTLYAHFPGKFDLLEAVLSDKFASVEAMLKDLTRRDTHNTIKVRSEDEGSRRGWPGFLFSEHPVQTRV